jgi:hypothetical protein
MRSDPALVACRTALTKPGSKFLRLPGLEVDAIVDALQRLFQSSFPWESLFHRHRLGQVSRLVHIAAATDGYVVRQQLQWDNFKDW